MDLGRASAPPEPPGCVAASYISRVSRALETIDGQQLEAALDLLLCAHAQRRRVYVIGNGGSAATAAHFACDFTKTVSANGCPGLRAHALADNVASLTAWANDTSYDTAFASQIATYVDEGDVVIAISASGNSPNIVAGLRQAAIQGASTLAIVGFDGGVASEVGDVVLHVRDDDYGCVEDAHAAIGHALTTGLTHAFRSALEAGT
ncbi:MAG: D-sedoheptulose-7-phosphate isomerase [Solirubrobacteraceae bacterium]